ncbi:MAG: hypothetical protein ACJAVS_002573 [Paracoccaceae bacterium]|jgi:hypothetical protein
MAPSAGAAESSPTSGARLASIAPVMSAPSASLARIALSKDLFQRSARPGRRQWSARAKWCKAVRTARTGMPRGPDTINTRSSAPRCVTRAALAA